MDQIIKSRVGYFLAGLCLIFFSIICRAGYLQIICHERYAEEASDNIYRSRRVSPLRGAIYDRNGVLLARDAPSYNISVRLGELFPDLDYRNKNRNNPPLFLPNLMYIERLCDLLTKHGYKVNQTYTEEILNENGELVEIETVKLELISIEYILERLESRFKNRVAVVSKKIDEKKEEYKKSPRRFNQERRNIEKDWYLRPNILLTNIPQSAAYELYQAEQTLKLGNIATILNESKKQSLTENYYQGFILETSMEREYPEKDLAAQFLGQMRLIREKELSFIKKAKNDLIQNFAQKFNIQMPENTSTHHLLFPAVKSFILHEQKIWQSEVSFTNMNVHDEGYINTKLREYEINTLLQKKESTLQGLSKITNKDLASILEDKSYYENDRVGSFGIESVFEFALRGTYGSRAEGRGNFQFEEPAIDGKNIYLSLDSHLQRISEQALDQAVEKSKSGIGGSVIFIHIPTGEIRVMATSPRYDNNRYRQDYTQLLEDPKNPLTNRCFAYNTPIPPGSTFKIAVALYALQHGFITPSTTYICQGCLYRRNGKRVFKCSHKPGGCGPVNVVSAIQNSCNVFFYQVGEIMGYEHLKKCAETFGFTKKSGMGFNEEFPGRIPKKTRDWGKGMDRFFGIGQQIEATPLQVANLMVTVATEGKMPQLRTVAYYDDPMQVKFKKNNYTHHENIVQYIQQYPNPFRIKMQCDIAPQYWKIIKRGMRDVMLGDGTGKKIETQLQKFGLKIAAKTGTSQVTNKEDHAWFAGFAPYDKPEYAFVAMIEHGGYGASVAGPVIIQVLKSIYDPDEKTQRS